MALMGSGMLVTFTEVAPADEQDFNEWYNREHLDERVNLPGFQRARRYVATQAEHKYVGLYECGRVEDLAEPGYLKLLANQTPWSQQVMKTFTKFHRLTLRIREDRTHGVGGAVTLVRFRPEVANPLALTRWLKDEALPAAIRQPGLLGGFAAENDLDVANAPIRAQGLDYPAADAVEWLAALEGADAAATDAAARQVFAPAALAPFGVTQPPVYGSYRFLYGNQR